MCGNNSGQKLEQHNKSSCRILSHGKTWNLIATNKTYFSWCRIFWVIWWNTLRLLLMVGTATIFSLNLIFFIWLAISYNCYLLQKNCIFRAKWGCNFHTTSVNETVTIRFHDVFHGIRILNGYSVPGTHFYKIRLL